MKSIAGVLRNAPTGLFGALSRVRRILLHFVPLDGGAPTLQTA